MTEFDTFTMWFITQISTFGQIKNFIRNISQHNFILIWDLYLTLSQ